MVAPENSLEAIREAARLGAAYVEVDVRTTDDGELVLMHDANVRRTTDGSGDVLDLAFFELRDLRLERPDDSPSAEAVPSLDEALAVASEAGVALYLDVKDATPERLARALERSPARVLVYQDDFEWLDDFHELAPHVPLLPECGTEAEVREAADRFGARAFATSMKRFEPAQAAAAHALGGVMIVDILGGGDDLEERARKALLRGADGIQTDAPARIRSLVGRWPISIEARN